MKSKLSILLGMVVILSCVSGCAALDNKATDTIASLPQCRVISSGDWQASISKGVSGISQLNISGEVELPNPGYDVSLELGKTDRAAIPAQTVYLQTISSGGMVAQVITKKVVSLNMETGIEKYRNISIFCGDELLAEIRDIK